MRVLDLLEQVRPLESVKVLAHPVCLNFFSDLFEMSTLKESWHELTDQCLPVLLFKDLIHSVKLGCTEISLLKSAEILVIDANFSAT